MGIHTISILMNQRGRAEIITGVISMLADVQYDRVSMI